MSCILHHSLRMVQSVAYRNEGIMYDHNGARMTAVVSFGVDFRNVHNPDIITKVPGISEETENDND